MADKTQKLSLEDAASALDQMTPEDYVDLMRYQEASELNLPEAPVSINFRATSEKGFDFQVTMRDWDENRLLKRLAQFAKALDEQLGISPSSKASVSAEPTGEIRITSDVEASVVDEDGVEVYEVSSIQHKIGKKGSYFKIKGGKYTQWGWNAFENVFPENVKLPTMAKDEETTNVPKELQYAYVNPTLKRVVAFAQSI